MSYAGSHWTSVIFSQSTEKRLTSFSFCITVQRHRWRINWVKLCVFSVVRHLLFKKTNRTGLLCLCAVIDTRMTPFQPEKMLENTQLRLVFPLGNFSARNDVVHVSITAQKHVSNVLFAKCTCLHLFYYGELDNW